MRKYFRQAGYFAAILILLPYVVTILLNGRSSLAQDNGTSPYVTVKSDEKNRSGFWLKKLREMRRRKR